eukprot:m.309414 g.309414  ORF g.309414 m.309414 type:complete len:232 (+) comp46390_c0_seq1:113-808(+)
MTDLWTARADQLKWQEPGWRIEQRYTKGVLIGNWFEEKREFGKGNHVSNSTHRADYRDHRGHLPDVTIRRNALARNDGIGRQHLFVHHGTRYSNNMLPLYPDTFSKTWHPDYTPKIRQWDRNKMSWQPEPIDQSLTSNSHNYGLHSQLKEKWRKQAEIEAGGDYVSNYASTYHSPSKEALVTDHYASRRHLSTRLHPHRANKDLQLRSTQAIPCIECPIDTSLYFNKSAPT